MSAWGYMNNHTKQPVTMKLQNTKFKWFHNKVLYVHSNISDHFMVPLFVMVSNETSASDANNRLHTSLRVVHPALFGFKRLVIFRTPG